MPEAMLSPLRHALAEWGARDDMGGFRSAGAVLFPGWTPKASCRAPHREDRSPSFSIYRNAQGAWRFKDHATGEHGGLVDFVALAGMEPADAARWLMEKADAGWKVRGEAAAKHPVSNNQHPASVPYSLSNAELAQCAAMSSALASNATATARLAASRCWTPATIRGLAFDGCLGLHDDSPVMIYPTGAKKRLKPLAPDQAKAYHGTKFLWLFGKPDSLWRGERILDCTEHVHITEGETDAINLIDAGLDNGDTELVMAVPSASCWRDEWAPAFRGRCVTLWPDPDEPGQRLKQRITDSLFPVARKLETAKTRTGANL